MSIGKIKTTIAFCLSVSIFSAQVVTPAIATGSDLPDIIPPGYPGAAIPLLNPVPTPPAKSPPVGNTGPSPSVPDFPVRIDGPIIQKIPKVPNLPPVPVGIETQNDLPDEEPADYWNPPVESVGLEISAPPLTLDVPDTEEVDVANQLDFLRAIGLPGESDLMSLLAKACLAVGSSSLGACASNSQNYSDDEKAELIGAMMTLIWTIAQRDPSTWTDAERKVISHIEERMWEQQIEYALRAGEAWEDYVDAYAKEIGAKPGFSKLLDVGPDATQFEPPSLYSWTEGQSLEVLKTAESIELAGGVGGLAAGLVAGGAVAGGMAGIVAAATAAHSAVFAAVSAMASATSGAAVGGAAVGGATAGGTAATSASAAIAGSGTVAAGVAFPAAVVVVAVLAIAFASAKVDGAKQMENALRQAVIDAQNTRPSLHEMATSTDADISSGLMLALYDIMVASPQHTSPDGQITFINQ